VKSCTTCGQRFSGEATFCPFDGTKLEGGNATEIQLARPSDEHAPGAVIGGSYRIDRILGEGGMGIVFAVTHLKLNKKFALKLLKRELARDPETRARFLVEAQAAGQIRHPNVVEITDYSSLPDGSAFMVMEYLEGQPLSRLIKLGGALPALRAVNLVRDVASALQAAHDAGVVHRDLKPDNVFVLNNREGREMAKILDFGVAKVAGSAKLTRTGMVFGTPHYMSPEQASGGAIDARTDVYALGVIMYEMFTGRVPFEADTYMGVLTKHMFEAPVPPSDLAGGSRELGALEDVCLKALAKRPEERYGSMDELARDLERIVRLGSDGRLAVATKVDGLRRPEVRGDPERARAFAKLNLADELELPARAEIAAATTDARERRVRKVGIIAAVALLGVAAGIAGIALLMRTKGAIAESPREPERPRVVASAHPATPIAEPTPTHLSANDPPAAAPTVATSTAPAPTAVPAASAATTAAAAHPTAVAPPPKHPPKTPSVISDVDDPWAKK
jgi:eukaryotic-like serine/threonine-protein kinase